MIWPSHLYCTYYILLDQTGLSPIVLWQAWCLALAEPDSSQTTISIRGYIAPFKLLLQRSRLTLVPLYVWYIPFQSFNWALYLERNADDNATSVRLKVWGRKRLLSLGCPFATETLMHFIAHSIFKCNLQMWVRWYFKAHQTFYCMI